MVTMGTPMSWRRIPERYGLIGSHCEVCGGNFFPARKVCPICRRRGKVKQVRFSGKGKIYSYTVIYSPPSGFELATPYLMAIVELDEGPKLTTQIVDCDMKDVKIGALVKMVFRKIQEDGEEGLIHYGFKFKVMK
jgi:hypothetical protein